MSLAQEFGDLDVYLAVDHSQLEIRVLAQVSKDPLLLELIKSGADIHCAVGHELTNIPIEKIAKNREIRTAIKGLHFGIIYGLSKKALFMKLKTDAAARGEEFTMTDMDVFKLYDKYFQRFSRVKEFIDEQVALAQKNFCVETIFGFKREITQAPDADRTTYWKNQSINSPIQGAAHQLMLISMAAYEDKKLTYELLKRMCMEIHDSLFTIIKLSQLVSAYRLLVQLMEREALNYMTTHWPKLKWEVPLKAEAKAGFRLGVLVPYEGAPVDQFIEKWCRENEKVDASFIERVQKDREEIAV